MRSSRRSVVAAGTSLGAVCRPWHPALVLISGCFLSVMLGVRARGIYIRQDACYMPSSFYALCLGCSAPVLKHLCMVSWCTHPRSMARASPHPKQQQPHPPQAWAKRAETKRVWPGPCPPQLTPPTPPTPLSQPKLTHWAALGGADTPPAPRPTHHPRPAKINPDLRR